MILVFGSLNADLFFNVNNLPKKGETVLCSEYKFQPGVMYNDLFSSCEKIGDHIINVSEAVAGEI